MWSSNPVWSQWIHEAGSLHYNFHYNVIYEYSDIFNSKRFYIMHHRNMVTNGIKCFIGMTTKHLMQEYVYEEIPKIWIVILNTAFNINFFSNKMYQNTYLSPVLSLVTEISWQCHMVAFWLSCSLIGRSSLCIAPMIQCSNVPRFLVVRVKLSFWPLKMKSQE